MNRVQQIILIGSSIIGSWLGMQAVHEMGHVVGALLTGGRIERVVLHPLTISRTDVSENSSPLIVVWAGPIIGVAGPLLIWVVAAKARLAVAFVFRFFAGFCLAANGLYIGTGSFGRIGDCGEMLQHGSTIWQLWLFGIVTVPAGLWLWHGQGTHFGLGQANGYVSRSAVYLSSALCMAVLILAMVVGGESSG